MSDLPMPRSAKHALPWAIVALALYLGELRAKVSDIDVRLARVESAVVQRGLDDDGR